MKTVPAILKTAEIDASQTEKSAMRSGFIHAGPDIPPTDLNQAIFRVILVSIIFVWTCANINFDVSAILSKSIPAIVTLTYLGASVAILVWTYIFVRKSRPDSIGVRTTRAVCVITDIAAVSIYTAIAEEQGIVLYPIYLTSCIGYGYRFGIRYLLLALVMSAIGFGLSLKFNSFLATNATLIITFYIGIICVPLYAATLLRRHTEVMQKLKETNAARERFIANMSHELRTPLHAILNLSDLLERSIASKDKVAAINSREKLQLITASAEYLLKMVNNILDIASSSSTELRPSICNFELGDAITSAFKICASTCTNERVRFLWSIDIDLPMQVISSREYIEEILINVIGNAIKYTNEGVVHCDFKIANSLINETELMICVRDTGIGIPERLLPHIFDAFTLGDDRASRKYSGTGLGLTLTRKFVSALNGEISIRSVEGVGTTCNIRLPLKRAIENTLRDLDTRGSLQECVVLSDKKHTQSDLLNWATTDWRPKFFDIEDFNLERDFLHIPVYMIDSRFREKALELIATLRERNRGVIIFLFGHENEKDALPESVNGYICTNSIVSRNSARYLADIVLVGRASICRQELSNKSGRQERISSKYKILVADDNKTNLKTAEFMLHAEGHSVHLVSSGASSIEALEKNEFDLAFIDLHMPNMSGLEVCQIYQYLFVDNRTPIIILTADVTANLDAEIHRAGAVAVLQKPLRSSNLLNAVHTYARQSNRSATLPTSSSLGCSVCDDVYIDSGIIRELVSLEIDEADLEEVVFEFAREGSCLVDEICADIRSNSLASAENHLHSLKGACAAVGAMRCAEVIQEIENELKLNDPRHIPELGSDLMRTLESSVSLLQCTIRQEYERKQLE